MASVTVYRSGATVRREAVVHAPGGAWPAEVRVDGLPLALDDGSLRVAVEPREEGTVPLAVDVAVALDVASVRDANLRPPRNEELEAARRAVAVLHRELQLVDARVCAVNELDVVERPVPDEGPPPGETPLAARRALVAFAADELTKLSGMREDLTRRLQEAQETLASLEDQERRASSARQPRPDELRKTVLVSLAGDQATAPSATLVLEYRVAGARWAPSYAVGFGSDYGSCRVVMRAAVCQTTGEDWTGVPLTLSTAVAQSWTELPELTSLRIGRRQPSRPRAGWRPAPEGVDALYADYDVRTRPASVPVPSPAPGLSMPMASFGAGSGLSGFVSDADDFCCEGAEPCPPPCEAPPEREEDECCKESCEEASLVPSMQLARMDAPCPPPCPRPMPAPSMAARSMAPASGGSAPRMRAKAEAMKKAKGGPGRGGPRAPGGSSGLEDMDGGGALEAPPDLLDYGSLRLAGPAESRRGHLVPMEPWRRYGDVMAALAIDLRVDVRAVLVAAAAEARQAEAVSLPPGCRLPEASEGFDYAFRTEAPVDLPSDGRFHVLPVLTREGETTLLHVCVPREATDVFRSVSFRNPLGAPLPAGPADVTVGRDYLLTTPLPSVPAGGRVELCLGVEQRIKVARNVHYDEATTGLLGGDRVLTHRLSVEVASNMPRSVRVEVRERVPVPAASAERDVTVTVADVEPHWERFEQVGQPVEGAWRWVVDLEPGAKRELRARYDVELPSKFELVGGNRREA